MGITKPLTHSLAQAEPFILEERMYTHVYKHTCRQICEHFCRVIIKCIRTFESRELERPAG